MKQVSEIIRKWYKMFEKLTALLNDKLSGPMTKLANQRHLRVIRDDIVATLPLIIVGSFFLIVANPPLPESRVFINF